MDALPIRLLVTLPRGAPSYIFSDHVWVKHALAAVRMPTLVPSPRFSVWRGARPTQSGPRELAQNARSWRFDMVKKRPRCPHLPPSPATLTSDPPLPLVPPAATALAHSRAGVPLGVPPKCLAAAVLCYGPGALRLHLGGLCPKEVVASICNTWSSLCLSGHPPMGRTFEVPTVIRRSHGVVGDLP